MTRLGWDVTVVTADVLVVVGVETADGEKKLDGADDGMIFGSWVPEGVCCCCCWLALVISFAAAVSCSRLREELPEGSAAGEVPYELSSVLAALATSATMGPLVAPVGRNTNWPLPFLGSKAWTCSK